MRKKYLIKSFNSKYETTSIEPLKSLKYGSVRKILVDFGNPLTQFGDPKKGCDP
jgi:hypothetical protein